MFKKFIILLFLPFIVGNSYSQKQGIELIDSLKQELNLTNTDTAYIRLLGKLSFQYYRFDTDSGIFYAQKALNLSEKIKWQTGIAFSYNYLGTNNAVKGNFPEALDYFNKSLSKYEEIDDKQGVAYLLNNLANFYRIHKEYNKSIEYLNKSISINRILNNNYELTKNYNNLGNIYSEKTDFLESNKHYYAALALAQELKNQDLEAQILINLAENKIETQDYCEAFELAFKALDISEQLDITYDKASYKSYIGAMYYKISSIEKVSKTTCKFYSSNSFENLNQAKKYLETSLLLLHKIGDQSLISETSKNLSNVYLQLGDNVNALKFYKIYSETRDSIFLSNSQIEIANIEKKQELELRDKQIQIQALTIEKKNTLIIFQIVFFILVLLFIAIASYFFYLKRKNNKAKLSEKIRKEAENELIESELRLSRAEKVAKIGNWKIILDTKEIIASKGAVEIYGVKMGQFTLEYIQKMVLSDYRHLLDEAMINLITKGIPYNVEFKIKTDNDHSIKDIHSIATFDSVNRIVFGVIHDITDQKKSEQLILEKSKEIESQNEEYQQLNEELLQINEELSKSKEQAEESDRLKTAFLQNMSHEIRTPMNAIMGFSSLIISNFDNKPKLEKFSEIINQRCNDLLAIINDILDIAKIESGQLSVNIEECNLEEMYAMLTSFFNVHSKQVGKEHIQLKLHCNCTKSESTIFTDSGKLKQILINLISNAYKFTEQGSIESGCRIDQNQKLIFYVTDTGIGIPKEQHNVIFERFTQLNPGANRLVSGTGLGLSIVKGLITLLGGEISLISEPGKGSTFSFSIPYKNSEIKPVHEHFSIEQNSLKTSGKTILLVEDDMYNSEYLKEILIAADYNLIHTEYGREAVQLSISKNIDIVLMDVRLPDINGYEATRQIRQIKPELIIIAQTAYASNNEKQKALDAGCNDYISKPTRQDLLIQMIQKHIAN